MKKNPLLYCFFIFIFGISIIDLIKDDKSFSELENRNLKRNVEFTVERYFKGSFQEEYEQYMSDQFILRDNWIDLKSISEGVLGKLENNNIIYGENEFLFDKFTKIDDKRVQNNINAINKMTSNTDVPVSIIIAPNSYEIYSEYVPKYAPLITQKDKIEVIYNDLYNMNTIDLVEKMRSLSNESLYYKTDHHWTTDGAYLAYKEFIKSIGVDPVDLQVYEKNSVSNFYGTYFSKAKPFNNTGDSLEYYNFLDVSMMIGDKSYDSLYDLSKLNTRDKYSMFLYGNNPITIIKNTKLNNGKKLLVFKDSYANSMVPFLTQNFEEIHVIDLRSFSTKVSEYINNNDFSNILLVYNFINFTQDANIVKLKM